METEIPTFLTGKPGQGYPGHWVGRFIWAKGEAHPFHFFLMARGKVNPEGNPRSAKLHITASDRYMLYLNGEYLGRGPVRSDPRWQSYDSYDVGSNIQLPTTTPRRERVVSSAPIRR